MKNITIKEESVLLNINPEIYPLSVIYSAAYVFLDKAYIFLDGSPESEVFVELKPKDNADLEKLGSDFYNELINYADYSSRAEKTRKIREMILQRAILTNKQTKSSSYTNPTKEEIENISRPWEEVYNEDGEKK